MCAKPVLKYGALSGAKRRIRQRGAWLSLVFTRLARIARLHRQRSSVLDTSRYREPRKKTALQRLSYQYALM